MVSSNVDKKDGNKSNWLDYFYLFFEQCLSVARALNSSVWNTWKF